MVLKPEPGLPEEKSCEFLGLKLDLSFDDKS